MRVVADHSKPHKLPSTALDQRMWEWEQPRKQSLTLVDQKTYPCYFSIRTESFSTWCKIDNITAYASCTNVCYTCLAPPSKRLTVNVAYRSITTDDQASLDSYANNKWHLHCKEIRFVKKNVRLLVLVVFLFFVGQMPYCTCRNFWKVFVFNYLVILYTPFFKIFAQPSRLHKGKMLGRVIFF